MLGEKHTRGRRLSDEAAWNLWLIWSMVLAATPRTVRLGLEPSVPGVVGLYLLDIAVLVLASVALLASHCGERIRGELGRLFRPPLVALGIFATMALVATEVFVGCVGHDSLAYRRYNQQLIAAEFFGGLFSLLGWAIAQPKGGVKRVGPLPFAAGFCCSFTVAVLSIVPLPNEVSPLGRCGLSAALVGALLLFLRAKKFLPSGFALSYTVGQLLFVSIWWGRWVAEPVLSKLFAAVLLLCVISVAVVTFLLRHKKQRGKKAGETTISSRNESFSAAALETLDGAEHLSPRERQVILLTLGGGSDSRIADKLGVSKSTVASLRRRSYPKLGVSGKKDLMKIAERLTGDMAPERSSDAGETDPTSLPIGLLLIVATVLPLVVLALWGDDLLASYVGWDGYLARGAASLALLLLGLFQGSEPGEYGHPSLVMTLAEGTCSILLAYGVRAAVGPTYAKAPCWYAVGALLLLVVARGSECGIASDGGRGRIRLVVRAGIESLSRPNAYCVLMGASCVCLFDLLGYRFGAPGVSDGLRGLAEVLMAITALLCLDVIVGSWSMPGSRSSEDGSIQPVLYLRGRGLSEVQAEVVALLASGVSPRQVCLRCHVSPGSLGTFRTRAYKKLGVNGMDDLRSLLEREANFPKRDNVSPIK